MAMRETATLGELIQATGYDWQIAKRIANNTISVQSEIARIRVDGDKVIVNFARSASKVIEVEPVVWKSAPKAKEMILSVDEVMTLQPCGSYFDPDERFALVPNNSMFWIAPEEWPG